MHVHIKEKDYDNQFTDLTLGEEISYSIADQTYNTFPIYDHVKPFVFDLYSESMKIEAIKSVGKAPKYFLSINLNDEALSICEAIERKISTLISEEFPGSPNLSFPKIAKDRKCKVNLYVDEDGEIYCLFFDKNDKFLNAHDLIGIPFNGLVKIRARQVIINQKTEPFSVISLVATKVAKDQYQLPEDYFEEYDGRYDLKLNL